MCNLELITKNANDELFIGKFNKKQIDLTKTNEDVFCVDSSYKCNFVKEIIFWILKIKFNKYPGICLQ